MGKLHLVRGDISKEQMTPIANEQPQRQNWNRQSNSIYICFCRTYLTGIY
jgi:hypothetical protein